MRRQNRENSSSGQPLPIKPPPATPTEIKSGRGPAATLGVADRGTAFRTADRVECWPLVLLSPLSRAFCFGRGEALELPSEQLFAFGDSSNGEGVSKKGKAVWNHSGPSQGIIEGTERQSSFTP